MTTLYTAKKYAVPALEAHCVEFLKKNLRADNAFMLLTQVFFCSRSPVRKSHWGQVVFPFLRGNAERLLLGWAEMSSLP